jgi:hypothetical protein
VKNESSNDKEEQQDKAEKTRRESNKKNEEYQNLGTSDFRLKFWF